MKRFLAAFIVVLITSPVIVKGSEKSQTITVDVTEDGFVPSMIDVKPDINITLTVTRKTESTCSTEILVPSKNIKKTLPLNETITVDLGKLQIGEIRFGCGMNLMDSGKIIVR